MRQGAHFTYDHPVRSIPLCVGESRVGEPSDSVHKRASCLLSNFQRCYRPPKRTTVKRAGCWLVWSAYGQLTTTPPHPNSKPFPLIHANAPSLTSSAVASQLRPITSNQSSRSSSSLLAPAMIAGVGDDGDGGRLPPRLVVGRSVIARGVVLRPCLAVQIE